MPAETTGWKPYYDVYIVVTFASKAVRSLDDVIQDMEILDEPPRWFLEPLRQKCYVANINGGDSIPYDNMPDLVKAAAKDNKPLDEWRDAHGHSVADVHNPYEDAVARFNYISENAEEWRSIAQKALERLEDEYEAATAELRKYESQPGVPLPEYANPHKWKQ